MIFEILYLGQILWNHFKDLEIIGPQYSKFEILGIQPTSNPCYTLYNFIKLELLFKNL